LRVAAEAGMLIPLSKKMCVIIVYFGSHTLFIGDGVWVEGGGGSKQKKMI
jgi:hypothetical protein